MRVPFLGMLVAALQAGWAMPAPADYRVWFEHSTVKVFQDTAPGDDTGVRLTAARNEIESFQVVIRAGTETLRNVMVQVSDLVQENGARLGADRIALYRVAYVYLPAHGKNYPDALPPVAPFSVPAAENQPVWIDVSVPAEAVPGTYRGTVTVQAEGQLAKTGPVELTVWRFALPETPHSRTAFGVNEESIAAFHGVVPGSAEHQALKCKYYELLVAHRAMPYSLPVPVESADAARYLDNPRVTAFCVPYVDDEAALRKQAEYLREKGWLQKAYLYVVDEPITKEHYDLLRTRAQRVHAADPGFKVVVPYFREPTFAAAGGAVGLLTGVCDIWCPKVHFYQEDFLTDRQRLGEEVWWYVCWEPGAPYANLYVDMAGVDHRALFWQQAHYRVQGFLYWGTTHWNPQSGTADPWTDMATVKELSPTVYGDGSLLYPGAKVGIDGPVASIRLKLIRAGLEDVEYLRLLEEREGWDAVRAVTGKLVHGLDAYARDVKLLLEQREAVGRRLSEGRP
ncbi:MAG: DUF4091 domain-containing protein [Pirellulaceae bacterium]|nr:DUF4091 domain-containing protein [Pirellulaceae bacterium]